MNSFYNDSIILIGPSGAGKSTTSNILSALTKMPKLSLDQIANTDGRNGIRKKYSREDYNLFLLKKILELGKSYGKPGIVDFGAGHSVFNDPEKFAEAAELLKPFKNIILLLPSKDLNQSLQIINSRSTGDIRDNEDFLTSPSNYKLAKFIVYANNDTPEELANRIIKEISVRKKDTEVDER